MLTIDADAHVIENDSTWEYMLESERQFRPQIVGPTKGEASVEYWLIDGRFIPWTNVGKNIPKESREMSDPYFFPLYEEAGRLDLPICVHSANGSITVHDFFIDEPGFCKFKLAVVGAFHSLVFDGIPERFPKLRIGIIEVGAQWLPYAVHDLVRRSARRGKQLDKHLLKDNRIYVACQTDDDLAYILEYAEEDNLVIGSDYGHADNASELLALRRLRDKGEVAPQVIDKILCANPVRFYGLSPVSPASKKA